MRRRPSKQSLCERDWSNVNDLFKPRGFARLAVSVWLLFFLVGTVSIGRGAEKLGRGVVAFPAAGGSTYVGWRLLADDSRDVGFVVYRSEAAGAWRRLNAEPIVDSTNYLAREPAAPTTRFAVAAVERGRATSRSAAATVGACNEVGGVVRLKLQGDYGVARIAMADLDGDGELDYVVRQPDFNVDPYIRLAGPPSAHWKKSPETPKLEAYRSDGAFLWRYDLGWGIETGTWYAPYVVYDLDGDGRAEVYCKGGPEGDPRDPDGRVTSGPEYLLKLDGLTGRELARLDWPSREGIKRRPENPNAGPYSYYSRNLLGIAYLDGKRPHLIVQRGKYTQIKLRAYDPALTLAWSLDIDEENHPTFQGAGMHGMHAADIDEDGRDELVIGAAAIDDDGKPLWTTQRGHPDVCYLGDLDPTRPGMEIFYGHEWAKPSAGVCMVDARTGETIWGFEGRTTHVHASGLVADIDPSRPGLECFAGEQDHSQFWLYNAQGNRMGGRSLGGLAPRAVWWEDSLTKLVIGGGRMFRFRPPVHGRVESGSLATPPARVARGSEQGGLWEGYVEATMGPVPGSIIALGDIFGDWREEFIISERGSVAIYSTTLPARTRRVSALQDRKYRTSVAMQSMGYLFPPISGRPLDAPAIRTLDE